MQPVHLRLQHSTHHFQTRRPDLCASVQVNVTLKLDQPATSVGTAPKEAPPVSRGEALHRAEDAEARRLLAATGLAARTGVTLESMTDLASASVDELFQEGRSLVETDPVFSGAASLKNDEAAVRDLRRASSEAIAAAQSYLLKRKMQLNPREVDGYALDDVDALGQLPSAGADDYAYALDWGLSSGSAGASTGTVAGSWASGLDEQQAAAQARVQAAKRARRAARRSERTKLTQAQLDALLADDPDFRDGVRWRRGR